MPAFLSTSGTSGFVQKYSGDDQLLGPTSKVARGALIVRDDAERRVFRPMQGGKTKMPVAKVLTVMGVVVLPCWPKSADRGPGRHSDVPVRRVGCCRCGGPKPG